jgi:hypothetical protein
MLSMTILTACGPKEDPAPDTVAETREAEPDDEVLVEAVAVGPTLEEVDLRVTPEQQNERARAANESQPGRSVSPNRVTTAPNAGSGGLWRADGRPTWWIDQSVWRDGRFTVCAEAFGNDVRSARRAAIEAARRDAGSALGGSIRDERVDSALVRAISDEATGKGRFVGYVKLTALRGE